jgi:DNA polymerase-3 subunit gamma/tau
VIIDEVHQLSGDRVRGAPQALEEPPAHLVFIFATTDPQKLPDTIRSRTQRFDFARVAIRRVADRLLEIESREQADADGVKFKLTDGAALLIAHKGEGSMRDAVSALDQVVSAGEPAIDEALVRRVLGIPDREVFFRVAAAVVARDPQTTLRELHEAFGKGQDPRELAEGLAEHFRDILVVKVDPEKGHELVAASNEDLARLKQQGEGWADTDLLRLMRLAAECQWPMRDSPQPLVHLEAAVLQMATLEPAESVAALIDRLEQLERRLGGGTVSAIGGAPARGPAASGPRGFVTPTTEPATAPTPTFARPAPGFTSPQAIAPRTPAPVAPMPAPAPAPARPAPLSSVAPARPTAAEPAASSDARLDVVIEAQWKSVMTAMNGRKRMLGAFLEEITLVGVTEDTLILSMDDLQRSVVDAGEHRPMLLEEMARVFGRRLELRVVKGVSKTQGAARRRARAICSPSSIARSRCSTVRRSRAASARGIVSHDEELR